MAGNARFDLTAGSPEPGFLGNYSNGPRGNYSGPNLDRSGSFREGGENRTFGSATGASRVSGTMMGNLPPLSQCLMLDPIIMNDPKYTRSGELRRVLGFSVGNASEENSFGAAHSRPLPMVAMEELKRYKETILDANNKARGRAKKLDEHLHKLNKYFEAVSSKKQLRNELSMNERSGASNLKMGTQILRNPPDLVTQRAEDRAKNVVPNRRVRTSVAETRAEYRSNGLARQPLVMAKDRDMLTDNSTSSDMVEEKIRRLPAGGEGWDKKMKRKRSVGPAFARPLDSDGELKRLMHHKFNEPGLQSCDGPGFRSGSNGVTGSNKLDSSSSPASSFARASPKHEQEKATLMRDLTSGLNKEKLLAKGNNKLNIREDSLISGSSPVTKGKISRAPRSGSTIAANSTPNIPRASGSAESWEQPSSANKIHSTSGANNRKRAIPSGSSSPPMAQWVGQRPQKMSRTRRANLVSPVSNHEEMHISSEGCSPDFDIRNNAGGTNGSLLLRGMANGTQQLKVKLENVSSPARFSESEESGAGDNRLKEKVMGSGELEEKSVNAFQNGGPSLLLAKKNKSHVKEEPIDGVRRQGRSGRGSVFSSTGVPPVREKLENAATTKPLRSAKPGSEKNGSKTGRPLKKLQDRKGISRRGHMLNSGSPDFTGESDDDHEELLAAANLARNASYHACSSSFWKKMEPIFASVSLEDMTYFSQQINFAEKFHDSLSQMLCFSNNDVGDLAHEEISTSNAVPSGELGRSMKNQMGRKESAQMVEFTNQSLDFDSSRGRSNSESGSGKLTPLYQRVLSALIVEDEIEEFEENGVGDIHGDPEVRKRYSLETECLSTIGPQTQNQCAGNRFFSCNGNTTSSRSPDIENPTQNEALLQGGMRFTHSNIGVLTELSSNNLNGPQVVQTNSFSISSSDSEYVKLSIEDKLFLELQSVGIYLDRVPDLDDGDDEANNQDISQLKKGLHQQISEKKANLDEVHKAIQQGKEFEARELERVAMDRLVDLAYKKILATRGSIASKFGIAKVSKQVALAFAKRTLSRCRTFEDSGISCFNEPALRDALFAAPLQSSEAEPVTHDGLGVGNRSCNSKAERHDLRSGSLDAFENFTNQSDQSFAKNGPISNRGKKKEVLLDDVGGTAALRPALGSTMLGGAKGKRSERDRDKDVSRRNNVTKAGRPSLSNFKGERKLKTKPKQKTAQLPTSGNEFVNKSSGYPVYPPATCSGDLVTNESNRKREVGMMSNTFAQDGLKETKDATNFANLPLPELDSIDELGVVTDLGGNQDLSSWFNFDEDGLQDHDADGLDIPMDDLSELNMFG